MNTIFVGLRLNDQNYLIPALEVRTILNSENVSFSKLTGNQNLSTLGMFFNFEDAIVAIDTSYLLGFKESNPKKVIYVLSNGLGLLAEDMLGVIELQDDQLERLPIENQYIKLVYNDVDHSELYFVLDMDALNCVNQDINE